VVSGETLFADVKERSVVIIDDLISTGTTLSRAARAAHEQGARRVYAAASHGLFIGHATQLFSDPALDKIVVTDSVPPFRLDPKAIREKLVVLDAAGLFAKAIRRMHEGESVVELLGPED
jgi:ribose-phosphate pyrophosphokinase